MNQSSEKKQYSLNHYKIFIKLLNSGENYCSMEVSTGKWSIFESKEVDCFPWNKDFQYQKLMYPKTIFTFYLLLDLKLTIDVYI